MPSLYEVQSKISEAAAVPLEPSVAQLEQAMTFGSKY